MEAALISFLAPFLPYLLKVGERAAQDAADALGTAAGQRARSLWAKLFPSMKPAAVDAAHDVAVDPDDELARSALQHQLRKLLQEDGALRDELARMLKEAQRAGVAASDGGVAVGGDVRADHGSIGVIGTVRGDLRMPGRDD